MNIRKFYKYKEANINPFHFLYWVQVIQMYLVCQFLKLCIMISAPFKMYIHVNKMFKQLILTSQFKTVAINIWYYFYECLTLQIVIFIRGWQTINCNQIWSLSVCVNKVLLECSHTSCLCIILVNFAIQ